MAILKNGKLIIGSTEEAEPKKCDYCGKIDELRPYGKNGANICFECGMKPENRDITDKMFNSLLDELPKVNPNNN